MERNLKFIPYNIGTFLVRSRSRHGYHHQVDLIECNCSCEAWQSTGSCEHLREAYKRRVRGRLPIIVAMNGRNDITRTEKMEERSKALG